MPASNHRKLTTCTVLYFLIFLLHYMQGYSVAATKTNIDNQFIRPTAHNIITSDKDGMIYLVYNNFLYNKSDASGDGWNRNDKIGNVYRFAIDPVNNKIFYVITKDRQIQKSMDGGQTWLNISRGFPAQQNTVFIDLLIDPHNTQKVFVLTSTGLVKTTDAGFSWESTSLHEGVSQLLIHPQDKAIYYAKTHSGLLISKDSGTTWSKIDDTLPKRVVKGSGRTAEKLPVIVKSIAYVNFEKPFLMAITAENGILKTEDNGALWKEMNNGFNKDDGSYSVYTSKHDIYIGSDGCFYHFEKNGEKWIKNNPEKDNKPTPTEIIGIYPIGDGGSGLVIADRNKIIYVDKHNNFIGLNYGVMPHSKIKDLKNGISNGQRRLYATVKNDNYTDIYENGLFTSVDGGNTWSLLKADNDSYNPNNRIFVSPHDNNNIYLFKGGDDPHFYTTNDGFNSWTEGKLILTSRNDVVYDYIFDPVNKNIRYSCNRLQLFKHKYNETSKQWQSVDLKVDAKTVAIDKSDNNKILTDSLKLSLDGGWTWKDITSNLLNVTGTGKVKIVYFNSSDIILFVKPGNSNSSFLVSSNDLGNSWKILKKEVGKGSYGTSSFDVVYCDPQNIFIADFYKEDVRPDRMGMITQDFIAISHSSDRGLTWTPFCLYKPSKDYAHDSIHIVKGDKSNTIYVGTPDGLYKTSDNGWTWVLLGGIENSAAKLRITPHPLLSISDPVKAKASGWEWCKDNGDGTVTDPITGLMWAADDNGKTVDWAEAKLYCENYKGGGHTDWRMPTQDELFSLYSEKRLKISTLITQITDKSIWASGTRDNKAAYLNVDSGRVDWAWARGRSGANASLRALPVRRGSINSTKIFEQKGQQKKVDTNERALVEASGPPSPMVVNGEKRFTWIADGWWTGMITDSQTGLEWVVGPDSDKDYAEAEQWVADCRVAGGGWRMPTRAELKTLYQKGVGGKRNIDPVFKFSAGYIWAEPLDSSSAWHFAFFSNSDSSFRRDISNSHRVFAVRSRPQ